MSKEYNQCAHSCDDDALPNKEPQAPSSIPVKSVDMGNEPLNKGGEAHGAGSPGVSAKSSL